MSARPTPGDVLADSLGHLEPTSLDVLVQQAALLTRMDRKYVVPLDRVAELMAAVPPDTRPLEIDGRRVFGYRSTYLDTPRLDGYFAAGRGRRRRFKVRTRAYLDTGAHFLEVKTRGRRGSTIKQRVAHHDLGVGPVSATGRAFVDDALAGGRVPSVRTEHLEPVLTTEYDRATLMLPSTGSRVTVDVDLGWSSLRPHRAADLVRDRLAVVETKTGSTPSAVDRLLWSRGFRPVRISKYGVGLAALDPTLPRLKWARTLRRELAVDPVPQEER